MSNGTKAQQRKKIKKTAGTKRGRKMKPKTPRKPAYNPLQWRRPPKMTDQVVQNLAYIFGIDGTKEEACITAGISTTTFDNWYNGKYQILWKFKELGFDVFGNTMQIETEREVFFHEIMDHAMAQPFIRARQAQQKNIAKGKERTLDTFLTTRDPRYKKSIDLDGANFNIVFGNAETPKSPFIKKDADGGQNDQ